MIVSLLLDLILGIFQLLFAWVEFPPVPDAILEPMAVMVEVIASGMSFVWLIVPYEIVVILLPIIVVIENFDALYSILMWIIKKIPFLNIK